MSDLLTIAQVAEILGVSEDTVTRRLAKLPGVIDLGSPERPKRRRYRVLRIPRSVVEKYVAARGGRMTIPAPTKAKAPPRKPPTEDELTRDLAALALRHGAAAQKLLKTIANRAKMLAAHLPPDEWADLVWCDGDEDESGDNPASLKFTK